MSQELTSAAGTDRTSTHQASGVTADDQSEIDFWTAALEEHSNRAMLNISRQALAKLLGIIGKLRTEQRALNTPADAEELARIRFTAETCEAAGADENGSTPEWFRAGFLAEEVAPRLRRYADLLATSVIQGRDAGGEA